MTPVHTPSPAAPLVWDVDVQRRYTHAGRTFDLQVRFASTSRRTVLFGPSGAGKSQTMSLIAGLTAPHAGHVRLAGETLFDRATGIDVPARARHLGHVFQDYALFPHLTVAQNVAFGLSTGLLNPRRPMQHPAVARWLAVFGLTALADHHPEQISGGQRQRTALARALAAEPRALLLDEPFAALDSALRARLRHELCELQQRLDIPMIVITHDEADVRLLGDTVIALADGRVAASPVASREAFAP